MADLRLIDGVPCSELGIALELGVPCAHGVLDGDKPLAQSGPRCLQCRVAWYPHTRSSKLRDTVRETVHCPRCGERLNLIYGMALKIVRDSSGRATGYRESFAPLHWAHSRASDCARSELPVVGYEDSYRSNGWGRWEQHAAELLQQA